jgi:hypothetical protein
VTTVDQDGTRIVVGRRWRESGAIPNRFTGRQRIIKRTGFVRFGPPYLEIWIFLFDVTAVDSSICSTVVNNLDLECKWFAIHERG